MKNIFTLLMVLLVFSFSSIAQEDETKKIYREIFNLERTRDSLQNEIKNMQADFAKEKQSYNANLKTVTDSMKRVIADEKKSVKSARDSVSKLLKDNAKLTTKVEKTTLIEKERDSLKKSTENYRQEIIRLRSDSTKLESRLSTAKKEEYEHGQLQIIQQIEKRYSADFDALVDMMSLETVQQDLNLIQDANIKEKAQQLQTYFQCRKELENLCHLKDVSATQSKLPMLPSTSKKVKELDEALKQYQIYVEGMLEWIDALKSIDDKYIGGKDEGDQKYKKGKICESAMDFLYNYSDFRQYPCLEDLFFEILNLKSSKVDAPLDEFKKRIE